MYKKIICLVLLAATLFGKNISRQEAQNIAVQWLSTNSGLTKSVPRSIQHTDTKYIKGKEALHIINFSPKAFVIIAADDKAGNVLAFSHNNNFDTAAMHPQLKILLDHYAHNIYNNVPVQSENTSAESAIPDTLLPLLKTRWDQNWPYNKFCPVDSAAYNLNNYRTFAGCVATATSQIMKFYNYPDSGLGYHTYNDGKYGKQEANYDSTGYKWELMSDVVNQYSAEENIDAIAELMYHCGVAVEMMYGINGSSAYSQSVPGAMQEFFNYSSEIKLLNRAAYSNDKFIKILKTELYDKRPIYYSGNDTEQGHAFVCDGYLNKKKDGQYFRFNWGWSGSGDGYYQIDNMNSGLNFGHAVVVNFAPAGQVPKFEADITKDVVPFTVQFHDLSEGAPTAWEWDFDGDGITDSYESNPRWTYDTPDDYSVTLKVTYDRLTYQKTYVEYIDAQAGTELYGNIPNDRVLTADVVKVLDNTLIPKGVTLSIMPGTKLQFNGNYELKIDGNIKALGTAEDSIIFTIADSSGFANVNSDRGGWKGIFFTGTANDTASFSYCRFNNVKKSTVIKSINNHNLSLKNCSFSNNMGNVLGLWFHNKNTVIIDKCEFQNNTNHKSGLFDSWGTALTGYSVDLRISNSIFRQNEMSKNGLIFLSNSSTASIVNATVSKNYHSSAKPSVLMCGNNSELTLENSILWNDSYDEIAFDGANQTAITNCDLQNGLHGISGDTPEFLAYESNINVDPRFADEKFRLWPWSQCIDRILPDSLNTLSDTVDFFGTSRLFNEKADIGAVEFVGTKQNFSIGFSADNITGDYPLRVTFSDTSSEKEITALKWDFDNDGEWDTFDSSEVSYTYERPGTFSVSMLAMVADSIPVFILQNDLIEVTGEMTAVNDEEPTQIPEKFYLSQNFPNPFNPTTQIRYGIPTSSVVKLEIYNIRGERVAILEKGQKAAGRYSVLWNGKNNWGETMPSGIYLYKLQSENFVGMKKMFLVK